MALDEVDLSDAAPIPLGRDDGRPLPNPGSDEARAGIQHGHGVECECHVEENNRGISPPADGWSIAGPAAAIRCQMHDSPEWRAQSDTRTASIPRVTSLAIS